MPNKRLSTSKISCCLLVLTLLILNILTNVLCIEVSHLKASAEKSALLLASRTDRFVAYQAWKEEEFKSLKAQAEKKIAALEKQHKFVLVRK